jgi:hypothetical protein
VAGYVLADHVSGQHDNVQALVERLGGSQVPNTLRVGRGEGEEGEKIQHVITYIQAKSQEWDIKVM